ncbi:MAG: hypothetical protein Q9184_007551 [Pyrenodesmia sp. 2 TL-2023]
MPQQQLKDHWTQEAYTSSASFVPELATTIIRWLNPQPHDRILDLGCGDGVLTAKLKESCGSVTGVDSSANLVFAAKRAYSSIPGLSFHVQDCRFLDRWVNFQEGAYTKIFSNAALHWILRDTSARASVLENVYSFLKPGGTFAFEMGGAGNVAEVHTALMAAVTHQGIGIEKVRELSPWFFPSEVQMKQMLEAIGFIVEKTELEYRPTRLTSDEQGGIEGWVRLMGAQFLEVLDSDSRKEAAVKEVCELLRTVITHEEDGSMFLGHLLITQNRRSPDTVSQCLTTKVATVTTLMAVGAVVRKVDTTVGEEEATAMKDQAMAAKTRKDTVAKNEEESTVMRDQAMAVKTRKDTVVKNEEEGTVMKDQAMAARRREDTVVKEEKEDTVMNVVTAEGDPSEYGGGGRGSDNYYSGGGMSGGQDYRAGGGESGYGGRGRNDDDDDDDYSGALHHAQEHGNSEDSSLFSSALGMLSGKKKNDYANEDMDEDSAVRAHQAMYSSEGSGSQHSSQTMGAGAAMQALKLFTGSGSGTDPRPGNSQNAFIGMAMGQASKLFDEQSAQGKVEPGADKQSMVNDAAKMALKMYLKSQGGGASGGGGGGGGGPGGLMGMASKFL